MVSGGPSRREPRRRLPELLRQPDVREIAGHGDVIEVLGVEVRAQRIEHVGAVLAAAPMAPRQVAKEPLADERARAHALERREMQIGQVRQHEVGVRAPNDERDAKARSSASIVSSTGRMRLVYDAALRRLLNRAPPPSSRSEARPPAAPPPLEPRRPERSTSTTTWLQWSWATAPSACGALRPRNGSNASCEPNASPCPATVSPPRRRRERS